MSRPAFFSEPMKNSASSERASLVETSNRKFLTKAGSFSSNQAR